ncbi:MAG: hypothetical protein PHQ11_00340 [Paludibacter sp.]|nr:hypothetical protein [Paludibacter sp.]MDD4197961.1 hypothetical protein [Paludibacter sp.]MDD4427224.1 hypothetical protein [Paludibacter sp.]
MKRIFFFLMALLPFSALFDQIAYPVPSSVSVANTSVSDVKNRMPFHNPASFSASTMPQIVCSFENRYIITELATKSFLAIYPTKQFICGFSFAHHGFSLYHEIMMGMAFSRDFSGKFSLGMQFNYHTAYFASSNSYHATVYPQIGLNIPIEDHFLIGFHVFNPFGAHIKGELATKFVPSVFSLGCAYDFSQAFSWRFQADKELSSNYRVATGFDYAMTSHTRFQLGVYAAGFLVPCLGVGFGISYFTIDLVGELHPLMGLTTIVQLQLSFNKK